MRRCELVTVVGEAGVGKSRLIDEFIALGERATSTVLRGRCLAYGDGITFWPLAEAVRAGGAASPSVDSIEVAPAKLATLVGGRRRPGARRVRDRAVADLVSRSRSSSGGRESCSRASRRERPLLVLFDDIHWAEPTFLDLIEQVVAGTTDAPLLLVCTTRHELVERLPEWSTGAGTRRIELARLSEEDTAAVAEHLLGMAGLDDQIRERIVDGRAREIRCSSSSSCRCSSTKG